MTSHSLYKKTSNSNKTSQPIKQNSCLSNPIMSYKKECPPWKIFKSTTSGHRINTISNLIRAYSSENPINKSLTTLSHPSSNLSLHHPTRKTEEILLTSIKSAQKLPPQSNLSPFKSKNIHSKSNTWKKISNLMSIKSLTTKKSSTKSNLSFMRKSLCSLLRKQKL